MNFDKDEKSFLAHIFDLAKAAYARDADVFSDFLNVRETAMIKAHVADLPQGRFFLYGGVEGAERVMACFPASFSEKNELQYPIACIKIVLKGAKFVSALPSHRDFLGAVLGLGIERRLIGDIYIINEKDKKEAGAYIFCKDVISDFIISELKSVGRSTVICNKTSISEISVNKEIADKYGTVPSVRLDVIIGEAFNLSRSKVKELINAGMVAVNSAETVSEHYKVSDNDIISARGYGKFIFLGTEGITKKERVRIHLGMYC